MVLFEEQHDVGVGGVAGMKYYVEIERAASNKAHLLLCPTGKVRLGAVIILEANVSIAYLCIIHEGGARR